MCNLLWRVVALAAVALAAAAATAGGAGADSGTADGKTAETRSAEELYRAAVAFQDREAYAEAAETWLRLLDAHPDDPLAERAKYHLGVCRLRQRRYLEAESVLKELLAKTPQCEMAEAAFFHLGLAQFSQAEGQQKEPYEAAAKTFQTMIERFPHAEQMPAARFCRAEALFALERRNEAVAAYREILETHPQHNLSARTMYGLGVALQELGENAEAGAVFDRFSAEFPTHTLSAEVHVRRGDIFWAEGHIAQARSRFALAAEAQGFPLADYALLREAQCRFEEDDFAGALERTTVFSERFADSPRLAEALLLAGDAALEQQQDERATRFFEQAAGISGPMQETALVRQALCLNRMGRYEQVLDCLKDRLPALTDPSAQSAALWLVGESHQQAGRLDEAVSAFSASLDLGPDAPHAETALWRLAQAERQSGARLAAEATLVKLLERFPAGTHLAPACLDLAQLKADNGDYAGAAEAYRKLCEATPNDPLVPRAKEGLADALVNLGDAPAAEAILKSLLESGPEPIAASRVQFALATARYQLGRHAEALEQFEKLAADDDTALGAKAAIMSAEVLFDLKRYEESLAYCQRVSHGYGGRDAPQELHSWQARGLLGAARCLAKLARGDEARSAITELSERFPGSPPALTSQQLLDSLAAPESSATPEPPTK